METERAINSLQQYVRQTVLQNLNSYSPKFLTKDIAPFKNYSVLPLHFHMKWAKDYELIEFEKPYRVYAHQFIRELSLWISKRPTRSLRDKNRSGYCPSTHKLPIITPPLECHAYFR